jgi:hypothetical protein
MLYVATAQGWPCPAAAPQPRDSDRTQREGGIASSGSMVPKVQDRPDGVLDYIDNTDLFAARGDARARPREGALHKKESAKFRYSRGINPNPIKIFFFTLLIK